MLHPEIITGMHAIAAQTNTVAVLKGGGADLDSDGAIVFMLLSPYFIGKNAHSCCNVQK